MGVPVHDVHVHHHVPTVQGLVFGLTAVVLAQQHTVRRMVYVVQRGTGALMEGLLIVLPPARIIHGGVSVFMLLDYKTIRAVALLQPLVQYRVTLLLASAPHP